MVPAPFDIIDLAAHDPMLSAVAHELDLYLQHYSVSGSLRRVLSGESEETCDAGFDSMRKGRYADIYALAIAMLPEVAYGSANKYTAWLAQFN